ncbi:MAG TPA: Fe-S cluster assembly protein SufD [Gemmatimonadaceae bacterium]
MTEAYLRDFAAFAANGGGSGPPWLLPIRRSAIERFGALGFPTPKNEDWHFTSVSPIAERAFAPAPAVAAGVARADVAVHAFGAGFIELVFVNGRFAPALSDVDGIPAGVTVRDLAGAWRDAPALLEPHLARVAGYRDASFTALNTAFMYDGAVIHIARDVALDRPIHLLFLATADGTARVSHPRTLIVAEPNASATVIESYAAIGDATYLTNAVTEAVLRAGATLTHLKLQRESPAAYHVGTVEARQERDSHFISFSFATGAALSRTNIYTVLDGEGSGATLDGLYMTDGTQHVDHQTRIEHAKPNTFSREVYKGILAGESHGVFNGKVYVRPEAQKTDGKQENNNLLLSERARVDTKPQLEIFADDVKCTHGATVGRLDDQALFYMKSRGIGAEHARKLLTYAFAAGVLESIAVEPVRRSLEAATLARFAW